MNTDNTEHSSQEDAPASRLLDAMPAAWRAVYDCFRDGHTLALVNATEQPLDAQAQAVLHAASAAVRAFRQEYERASTRLIAAQIRG